MIILALYKLYRFFIKWFCDEMIHFIVFYWVGGSQLVIGQREYAKIQPVSTIQCLHMHKSFFIYTKNVHVTQWKKEMCVQMI